MFRDNKRPDDFLNQDNDELAKIFGDIAAEIHLDLDDDLDPSLTKTKNTSDEKSNREEEANKKNQAYKKAYKKKFFFLNQKTVLPYSERFVPDDAVIKKQDGKFFVDGEEVRRIDVQYRLNALKKIQYFYGDSCTPVPQEKINQFFDEYGPVYDNASRKQVGFIEGHPVITGGAFFKRKFKFFDTDEPLTLQDKKSITFNPADGSLCTNGRKIFWDSMKGVDDGKKRRRVMIATPEVKKEAAADFFDQSELMQPLQQPIMNEQVPVLLSTTMLYLPGITLTLNIPATSLPSDLLSSITQHLIAIQQLCQDRGFYQQAYTNNNGFALFPHTPPTIQAQNNVENFTQENDISFSQAQNETKNLTQQVTMK